ncbi:helix-turn-helix domain-containing protein [Pseudomonas alkylphenolica]|uniref:helix-turn-helix domain-containing protein n=1 Tax=Pseudomonas alkylphenolica TaxID=237609 RepID=UPI0018D9F520|nr:AraC family transcriptional regulator [Pseudomonas alkylphenolica]MBH3429138.1 helix-turn-helix transcriptional regulator [Pseudomonas alkylphenolica]
MSEAIRYNGGRIDLEGLHYELEAPLQVSSQTWDFGRVDQIEIQGDHLIKLNRSTHSLVFFSQGENQFGQARVDGKIVPHGGRLRGKIDVLPKGSEFKAAYEGSMFCATVMSIDPRLAELLPSSDGRLDLKAQTQLNDNFIQMMCGQFTHASDPLLRESILMTLLVYMSRKPLTPQTTTGFNPIKKARLADYIEEHLQTKISVGSLAAIAAVSQFHFLRLFKQSFNVTPYQYILSRRIARAKILLAHTSDAIDSIGYECGFSSASQFSQAFSRCVGLSPSSFRKTL